VTIAALDQARHDLAIDCIQQLHRRFPKSTRVTKLQAMRLEALGNYDDAEQLYERLIEADNTNPVPLIFFVIMLFIIHLISRCSGSDVLPF
jgi:tetratricopeptide (TPR) repeat protein